VTVHLFGPARPRRVAVVADLPVARRLVTATLGTGAAVVVRTGRPAAWDGVASAFREPDPGRVSVLGPDDPVPAHLVRPTVTVEDDPPPGTPDPGRYPAIDVLPVLSERTVAGLRRYDLLVLGRTTQIDALHTGYGVPVADGRWLARLPEDVLALAAPNGVTYVSAGQPQIERT
jgi:hypothetical protein